MGAFWDFEGQQMELVEWGSDLPGLPSVRENKYDRGTTRPPVEIEPSVDRSVSDCQDLPFVSGRCFSKCMQAAHQKPGNSAEGPDS